MAAATNGYRRASLESIGLPTAESFDEMIAEVQDEAGTADGSQYNYQIGYKMWQKLDNYKKNDQHIGVNECIDLINKTIKENSKHLSWNVILNQHTFKYNPKLDENSNNNNNDHGTGKALKFQEIYLLQHAIFSQCDNTYQLVELMLSLGADPNIYKGEKDDNSLLLAARTRQANIVKLLLYHGNANINFQHPKTRYTVSCCVVLLFCCVVVLLCFCYMCCNMISRSVSGSTVFFWIVFIFFYYCCCFWFWFGFFFLVLVYRFYIQQQNLWIVNQ